jgi:hypothetical protein
VTRPVVELAVAVAVMLVGAWLIGWWAVGVVLIAVGGLFAVDAVLRDDVGNQRRSQASNDVLERWRRAR